MCVSLKESTPGHKTLGMAMSAGSGNKSDLFILFHYAGAVELYGLDKLVTLATKFHTSNKIDIVKFWTLKAQNREIGLKSHVRLIR